MKENANQPPALGNSKKVEGNISSLNTNSRSAAALPLDPAEVIRMGGRMAKGIVEKRELTGDVEVRVSMRSSKYLGSGELFTLRNLEPADYHLILLALPRNKGSG